MKIMCKPAKLNTYVTKFVLKYVTSLEVYRVFSAVGHAVSLTTIVVVASINLSVIDYGVNKVLRIMILDNACSFAGLYTFH